MHRQLSISRSVNKPFGIGDNEEVRSFSPAYRRLMINRIATVNAGHVILCMSGASCNKMK
ncbi:hypothetical protein GCM10008022_15440 [Paenibacillus hunanensis]|nr:hypothetical protein GCM10008022_15440 [Paenibacillus hunanensis]